MLLHLLLFLMTEDQMIYIPCEEKRAKKLVSSAKTLLHNVCLASRFRVLASFTSKLTIHPGLYFYEPNEPQQNEGGAFKTQN